MNPPFPAPNIILKPISQKNSEPKEKSIIFFMRMFAEFLALVKPASTIANPGCINITRAAARSTHTVSVDAAISPMLMAIFSIEIDSSILSVFF